MLKERKNYEQLHQQLSNNYDEKKYLNISIGALELIGKDKKEVLRTY